MKSKKKSLVISGIIALYFLLNTLSVLAAPPDNYTCKLSFMGMAMPMAKMGNKTRVDSVMFADLVTVTLMDQNKTINMNTKNKTYFEHALQERMPSIYNPKTVIEKKKIGQETIDGHPCLKYSAVFYSKDKPQEKFSAILWEAQDLGGLPIKSEVTIPAEKRREGGPDKFVSEMKEIKVGAAKPSLFEVPKDYKKVASMQEVMGMGQGNMGEMMKQMQKKGKQ
ncbi:MAG: hypothetical protein AB1585_21765 [Thermodesulfobacteriota bacterium]